jgi:hypothetical protein
MLFFPLDDIVKKQLDQQIAANQLPVRYSSVSASFFSTTIEGISMNGIEIGTLDVSYSPLSYFTKSVHAVLDSPFGSADVENSSGTITVDIKADMEGIGKLLNMPFAGTATLEADYELETQEGKFTLASGAMELEIPFQGSKMPVKFDSLAGNGTIAGTMINIESLEAAGAIGAKANGQIGIDPSNIKRSSIALSVEASLYGANVRAAIRGSLFSPQVVMG